MTKTHIKIAQTLMKIKMKSKYKNNSNINKKIKNIPMILN